ncbi:MAG: hypothetical protein AB1297_04975, partial [bacterium]
GISIASSSPTIKHSLISNLYYSSAYYASGNTVHLPHQRLKNVKFPSLKEVLMVMLQQFMASSLKIQHQPLQDVGYPK